MKTFEQYLITEAPVSADFYESLLPESIRQKAIKITRPPVSLHDSIKKLHDKSEICAAIISYFASFMKQHYKIEPHDLDNMLFVDKSYKYNLMYSNETNSFELASGIFVDNFGDTRQFKHESPTKYRIFEDGKLHSTDYPATYNDQRCQFYIRGEEVMYISLIDILPSDNLMKIPESDLEQFLISLMNRLFTVKQIMDLIIKSEYISEKLRNKLIEKIMIAGINSNKKENINYCMLHCIQPEYFSDKIAKLLTDRIPINLAYFLLTKHMELYSNILKCYSDKHKFIEDMKEGDDIHHMGIASALERLIKHEDI